MAEVCGVCNGELVAHSIKMDVEREVFEALSPTCYI